MSNERSARAIALEEALKRWAADRKELTDTRNGLVRSAHDAGISKYRIWMLSGIARTTIDDILSSGDKEG